jgi:hypothetical protein
MRPDQKNEVLALYLGYFVTLAFGLIPSISYYAIGALVLQAFYAFIRYMSASEPIFRSHLFNYLLGVGVSFIVAFVLTIQGQAFGLEVMKALTGAVSGTGYKYDSAVPAAYVVFMMVVEILFAIFWPIVLISRGLYLLNTGVPIFVGFRKQAGAAPGVKTALFRGQDYAGSRARQTSGSGYLLSAILQNGSVVQAQLHNSSAKVIGRDSSSDLHLDDPTVSRRHALIEVRDGIATVKDLGSANGTKIAGRKIGFNPVEMQASDTLQIGAIKLTISAL